MHLLPADRSDHRVIDAERVCQAIAALDHEVIQARARQFAVLADPTRLTLFTCIKAAGPISVSDLAAATGINDATVSQTLRHLRASQTVIAERGRPGRPLPARQHPDHRAASRPVTVDLALVNGNVLTMDPARPRATAVSVAGGRITALDEISPGAARVVDLRGATVLPGFHDAHNHMIGFGMSLGEVDISSPPVRSLDELYAAIARRAEATEPGEWVIGSGYDQNKLGGHHPDRDALDRAAPRRRVWLRHTSGHMCVVNSLVLADLGVDSAATEFPAAGSPPTPAAAPPACSRNAPSSWWAAWSTRTRWPS